jgi:hypothetical protein
VSRRGRHHENARIKLKAERARGVMSDTHRDPRARRAVKSTGTRTSPHKTSGTGLSSWPLAALDDWTLITCSQGASCCLVTSCSQGIACSQGSFGLREWPHALVFRLGSRDSGGDPALSRTLKSETHSQTLSVSSTGPEHRDGHTAQGGRR